MIDQPTNTRGKYQQIDTQARMRLIELVEEFKLPISKGAAILQIALSTAKLIIKKYRTDGSIFRRKQQRIRKRKNIIPEEGSLNTKNNFLACDIRSREQNEGPILYSKQQASQYTQSNEIFIYPIYFTLYPPFESYFAPCPTWSFP